MSKIFSKYNDVHFLFWVFTLAVLVIAILPSLVQDGMFIDGIQYAVVSKNLANGLGTFWFPHISQNWNTMGSNVFLENPPLVYGIQSLFFRIFGDSLYTERIYCLFTALVSVLFIAGIWKLVNRNNKEIQKLSWLPVLIWISVPIVFRSYQMNVQENTMGIFILASVFFVLKGLASQKLSILYILLGGVFIFLSTLCKGATGLFPIVAVAIFWVSGGKIKFSRAFFYSLILFIIPVLLYVLILLNDNANESLTFYYKSRLLERISNDSVVNSHFHIIFVLLINLLPGLIVSFIAFLIRRKKVSLSQYKEEKTHILLFFCIGLAGSLPLALTLVQRDFYLGPSLPFFALALALFTSLYLEDVFRQFSQKATNIKRLKVLSISFLLGGLIYTGLMLGKTERDQDILHDTYLFGELIEEGSRVHLIKAAQDDTLTHWNLELYLARYFNISLGLALEDSEYIILAQEGIPPDDELFEIVPLDTETYRLYQREE